MKKRDEIMRRTAMRTLNILMTHDSCEDARDKISSLILLLESTEEVDYIKIAEDVTEFKKISKKAKL